MVLEFDFKKCGRSIDEVGHREQNAALKVLMGYLTMVARRAAGLRQAQTPQGESRRILGMGMTWIRIRLILTSKEVLSVKGEDLLFFFFLGFHPAGHQHPQPLLILKKGLRPTPQTPLPSPGQGLNRSSCRSYIKVSSDHQRSGLFFYRLR